MKSAMKSRRASSLLIDNEMDNDSTKNRMSPLQAMHDFGYVVVASALFIPLSSITCYSLITHDRLTYIEYHISIYLVSHILFCTSSLS